MAKSPDLEGFWRYQKSKNIFYYHKGTWIKKSQFLVGNKYYYFNKSGVLVTDSFRTFKNSKGQIKTCYFNTKGVRVNNTTKNVDGNDCVFSSTGNVTSRINKLTYINQSRGVLKDGKYTNNTFCSEHVYNAGIGNVPARNTISSSGCGITCCAMAITALTGKLVLPNHFNNKKSGFNGIGSNQEVGRKIANQYADIKAQSKKMTKSELKSQLLLGKYVLCCVNNSIYGALGNTTGGDVGHGGGHFILIYGYKDGKFAVADPNNPSQTYLTNKKLQTYESFNSHLLQGHVYTALWNKTKLHIEV